jgi:hypothetical protein
VLRIFISLKNPSPRPGLNPRTLGLTTSTHKLKVMATLNINAPITEDFD